MWCHIRAAAILQIAGDRILSPETRIGSAKLAAVLRYLNTYRVQAAGRQAISSQEQAALDLIKEIVQDLRARFPAEVRLNSPLLGNFSAAVGKAEQVPACEVLWVAVKATEVNVYPA